MPANSANFNIKFPLQFDNRGRTAASGYAGHIDEMLRQLIFTSPGERVNRPDFGSGLLELIFAPASEELLAALHYSVQSAIQLWLSDLIELKDLEIDIEDSLVQVTIQYVIRRTSQPHTVQFAQAV